MSFIADLHIHSRYSRATAKDMDLPELFRWAKIKGVSMLGTGDFTHPDWLAELETGLEEAGYGTYNYRGVSFILSAEVSNIYSKAGRTRKVHNIIFAPDFKAVAGINRYLSEYGTLTADGRPMLGLDCDTMVRALGAIDPDIFVVPAHVWTPHFSVFGSRSGFDSLEECFEGASGSIFALETGLSSDPAMNRRWSALDRLCLISNSDAHSPSKIGREANVFRRKLGYRDLFAAIKGPDRAEFLYTIEFFPEEGKYHWDGHRACGSRLSPEEAVKNNNNCPVCGKKITVGVMHRVDELADRKEAGGPQSPARKVVPLIEIISETLGVGTGTKTAETEYFNLIKNCGTEFNLLLEMPEREVMERCPARVAAGVINMRKGNVEITPGYDGEYGRVSVFRKSGRPVEKQVDLFSA